MAIRKDSFGYVVHTRNEFTDNYEGWPVPGGLVEIITVSLPNVVDEAARFRLASINEAGKSWNTGEFPVHIEDVPVLSAAESEALVA